MFKKLRNRFLLMNMVIISIIMLVAFTAIYTITYQDVRRDIGIELQQVSEFYRKPGGNLDKGGMGMGSGMSGEMGGIVTDKEETGQSMQQMPGDRARRSSRGQNPPPELSVSFALQTDRDWNLLSVNSRFDMDEEFYELAKEKADLHPVLNGQFTLDGKQWAYTVQQSKDGYSIVYLDVSAQLKILTNLIYTFSAVALIMLVVIYLTSRYFANRSIAPVKEAFDKQKRFIADASHELKTPLAVINTNADVLLANSEDTIEEQAKWLHHIKSETERMKTLTNDLLYLTQMDDAREQMIHVPFNLSEAVESIILTMEAVIFEKEIDLAYEIEPGQMLTGNSEQIKQVVMILLDNAIKYTHSKGTIELSLKKQHNHLLLKVSNTGEGIAPEHLGKIFDRFYRADTSRSRKHGGYGLGLAIAKSIVEQHKGKIYVKSVPGETTSFYVQLG
ncbi:HAMP domain-containing sensor histidine kinase [Paenibacillus vini]|uniref:sensor histidine kinase n=1 Tax=Paenibacillus vini TaxID=1476024 RepID=UPI0025B64B32|nr:HAMP domain-containing sensor histidine kinase [Paenibacillus vini]MDN4068310.1 HAMP domain-containing sensor histidine kinase [Paenibacillus vini]